MKVITQIPGELHIVNAIDYNHINNHLSLRDFIKAFVSTRNLEVYVPMNDRKSNQKKEFTILVYI
jgi:hypothetical protein